MPSGRKVLVGVRDLGEKLESLRGSNRRTQMELIAALTVKQNKCLSVLETDKPKRKLKMWLILSHSFTVANQDYE